LVLIGQNITKTVKIVCFGLTSQFYNKKNNFGEKKFKNTTLSKIASKKEW
jgi:hypothetical protein